MPGMNEFFNIDDISKINLDQIVNQLPNRPTWGKLSSTQTRYIDAFLKSEDVLKKHGIDTALRLGHFLGQGLIETGFLSYTSENLNYSADGLMKVFGKYFSSVEQARSYARQPEKIANRVYANRMGNGDEASGDGWKYRGRGFTQLTGKSNYVKFAEISGLPIDTDPDLISRDLKASIEVAANFFETNNLSQYADADNARAVSRGINFGNPNGSTPAHGEADRIAWTEKALDLFRTGDQEVLNPRDGGVLKIGSKGEKVEEFQRLLAGLNYAVGGIDGDYGPATSRVVTAFQQEAGLPTTGQIDKMTALAIDAATEGTPTPINRTNATADDLSDRGDETPDDTNKIGVATVIVGGVAAAGAAVEVLGSEGGENASETPTPADTGMPPPSPTPDTPETPVITDTPTPVPTETVTPSPDSTVTPTPDQVETPAITPTPDVTETTGVETPSSPAPQPTAANDGPNWILVAVLGVVVIGAIFIFLRAGKIKKDKVQDYRDGKVV